MYLQVRYTLCEVVSTLAMVEDETKMVLVKTHDDEKIDPDAPLAMAVDDVVVLKQKPITSSIRGTVQHLVSRAGPHARWRGLSAFIVYHMAFSFVSHGMFTIFAGIAEAFDQATNAFVLQGLSFFFTTVVLARLHMTVTHIIISEPSEKPWYRRVLSLRAARKIRGPAAMVAICKQLTFGMPILFFYLFELDRVDFVENEKTAHCVAMKLLATFGIGLVAAVGLLVPATVALTRCEASMLPEEDETIVPFDRTFGGKVTPEILGGSGRVGYLEAWASFSGASRIRLLKLFGKIIVIDVLLHAFFLFAFAVNAWAVFGDGAKPFFVAAHAQLTGRTLAV